MSCSQSATRERVLASPERPASPQAPGSDRDSDTEDAASKADTTASTQAAGTSTPAPRPATYSDDNLPISTALGRRRDRAAAGGTEPSQHVGPSRAPSPPVQSADLMKNPFRTPKQQRGMGSWRRSAYRSGLALRFQNCLAHAVMPRREEQEKSILGDAAAQGNMQRWVQQTPPWVLASTTKIL